MSPYESVLLEEVLAREVVVERDLNATVDPNGVAVVRALTPQTFDSHEEALRGVVEKVRRSVLAGREGIGRLQAPVVHMSLAVAERAREPVAPVAVVVDADAPERDGLGP